MLRNGTVKWEKYSFFSVITLLLTQYCSAQFMGVYSGRERMGCMSNSSFWEDCQCIGVYLHSDRVPRKSKSIWQEYVKTSGSRTGEPAIDM